MDRHPVSPVRRRRYEQVIRIIDLIVYAAVAVGGVYAIVATPTSIVGELAGAEWLIVAWSVLLFLGGAVGFVGRLTRWWMVEVPATVLAFTGIAIYIVVLGARATTSLTAAVAVALVIVAGGALGRRWAELQIFSSEPGHHTIRTRVEEALRRRTQNVVPRDE